MTAQVGGLGSGRNLEAMEAYLDQVVSDAGLQARAGFQRMAREIALIPGASRKFYWQIGNEINTDTFSSNLHQWAGDGLPGAMHDQTTIPILVEYFIAPAVAGIHQACEEVHGDDTSIRIMLGSIAVAANGPAQDFLAAMLDYTVVGTYAPSEAGKQVRDLVDTLSIHYMMGATEWEEGLDAIRLGQFGRGRVSRVISTEEVGIRAADEGSGVQSALRTLGRYQYWWNLHGLSPDVSRVFFYGTSAGAPSIDTELPLLLAFTGAEALLNPSSPAIVMGSGSIECREFEVGTTGKRLLLIFASDRSDITIDAIDVPWGHPVGIASADVYETASKTGLLPSTTVAAGRLEVQVGGLTVAGGGVLVLRLAPDATLPTITSLGASSGLAVAGGFITLSVLASDDAGISSYAWTQVSGPSGGAVIASAASASTEVAFSLPGSYVFGVTVTDASGNASSATLVVEVGAAPDPVPESTASSGSGAGGCGLGGLSALVLGALAVSGLLRRQTR
jgi:hypothetical protein